MKGDAAGLNVALQINPSRIMLLFLIAIHLTALSALWLTRLDELLALLESGAIPQRGEFVLVVAGCPAPEEDSLQESARRLIEVLLAELSPSQSARLAARATGLPKKHCYQIALAVG